MSIAGMARPENAGFLGRSGPCPRNASDKRQASPADPKRRSTAQPFDRSHAPAWERHPDAPASPNRQHPSPGGVLFFACPKKRTRRVVCATPLRKGSPAAETTPVDGVRNRRGKNSLRSDSLPLVPGSTPRRPAQRQRAVFRPRKPVLPRTVGVAGPAFLSAAGGNDHMLISSLPSFTRGLAGSCGSRPCPRWCCLSHLQQQGQQCFCFDFPRPAV